jgi:hypothetical protein
VRAEVRFNANRGRRHPERSKAKRLFRDEEIGPCPDCLEELGGPAAETFRL